MPNWLRQGSSLTQFDHVETFSLHISRALSHLTLAACQHVASSVFNFLLHEKPIKPCISQWLFLVLFYSGCLEKGIVEMNPVVFAISLVIAAS